MIFNQHKGAETLFFVAIMMAKYYYLWERKLNNMKKASKILFLIGGIVTILAAIAFIVIGIVALAAGALATNPDAPEWVTKLIQQIVADNPGFDVKKAVDLLNAAGYVFVVLFAFAVAAVVLSFICSSKDYRPLPLLIVATAFAVVGGSPLSILGGIFGIINWAQERRNQASAA